MKLELRAEVEAFAQLMEQKLRENDGKGGWKHESTTYLSRRCGNELEELRAAVTALNRWRSRLPAYWQQTPTQTEERARLVSTVAREAADVANFAMMLADVCGGLAAPAPGEKDREP